MSNDRELTDFVKRPNLYIIVGPNDGDRGIAKMITAQLGDVTDLQCLTLQEAIARFPQRILPGSSVAVLSTEVLEDPTYAATLCRVLARSHRQSFFRHYCVSRGLAPETLRGNPSLTPLFESVMVLDSENHLPALIADMRDFVVRVVPNSPAATTLVRDNWKLGITLWIAVACSYIGRIVLKVYRLSFFAGLALIDWLAAALDGLARLHLRMGYRLQYRRRASGRSLALARPAISSLERSVSTATIAAARHRSDLNRSCTHCWSLRLRRRGSALVLGGRHPPVRNRCRSHVRLPAPLELRHGSTRVTCEASICQRRGRRLPCRPVLANCHPSHTAAGLRGPPSAHCDRRHGNPGVPHRIDAVARP